MGYKLPGWSISPPLLGPWARNPRKGKVHRPRAVGARGHIVHSEVPSLLLPECRAAQSSIQALGLRQALKNEMQGHEVCRFPSRETAGRVTQWRLNSIPRPPARRTIREREAAACSSLELRDSMCMQDQGRPASFARRFRAEPLCSAPTQPKGGQLRARGRVGGRRLGERPALAARGHRGNYTPRCRRLPARPRIPLQLPSLLRTTACSILARAPRKRGGGRRLWGLP
ncbi:hypothetical protein NN561_012096 [Cricetulus griseus]